MLIAEHSICQPGLPGPQGESQFKPSLVLFHKTKSVLFFFSGSTSTLEPEMSSSIFLLDNFPYFLNDETEKYINQKEPDDVYL